MAKDRLSLQSDLITLLGSTNVYFQPPSSLKLKYPCIIYKLDDVDGVTANDKKYLKSYRYLVTVVDADPDTSIYKKVLDLPLSAFETHFVSDNLNHYVCSLYY